MILKTIKFRQLLSSNLILSKKNPKFDSLLSNLIIQLNLIKHYKVDCLPKLYRCFNIYNYKYNYTRLDRNLVGMRNEKRERVHGNEVFDSYHESFSKSPWHLQQYPPPLPNHSIYVHDLTEFLLRPAPLSSLSLSLSLSLSPILKGKKKLPEREWGGP
jgi:hypothetical protein